ncbi:MAG: zinc-binding dehydrogenase, partial [Chloroflexota bacterium]
GSRADQFPFLLGGLADYQYVPPGCDVIKVPASVSSASAAAAACAYRTVMHGFERLGAIAPHETVVVQGSGPLGLFASVVARDRGAYRVLVIGAPDNRLQVARELGADDVLSLDEVKDSAGRVKWVQDRSGGRGADIVIQCATHMAVPEGIAMVRKGGRYLSVGVGGDASISPTDFWRSVTIIPVTMAEPRHWLQAVRFLESRGAAIPFDSMISRSYKLEQATEAMNAMANFEVVKPVIYPNGG